MKSAAVELLKDMDWMLANERKAKADAQADVSSKKDKTEIAKLRKLAQARMKENYQKIMKDRELYLKNQERMREAGWNIHTNNKNPDIKPSKVHTKWT